MRLAKVEHQHRFKEKLLIKFIGLVSRRRVPDVIRTLLYRRDFLGDQLSAMVQTTLRGDSEWSVSERELFAAFTSKLEACHF